MAEKESRVCSGHETTVSRRRCRGNENAVFELKILKWSLISARVLIARCP